MGELVLTERFDRALGYASQLHRSQKRKGSEVPYISHLLGVAALAIQSGADEDQAIAALLHDAVEDQGGLPQLVEIRRRFGDRVASLVEHCTDSFSEEKEEWEARKAAYLEMLPRKPPESLLVILADKTHNASCIVSDLAAHGDATWQRFKGGREGTLWYYSELVRVFRKCRPGPRVETLAALVDQMRR